MTQEIKQTLVGTKRVKILVGEFGSGKTELAINYAIQLKRYVPNVAIVDIDLVKPYFRTRENRILLEKKGIVVIAPEQRWDNSDLPILPQHLMHILYDTNYHIIMDVGGGESAIVLAQIQQQLEEISYEAIMVINTRRPFTDSVVGISDTLHRIEKVSQLKIDSLISNTNLAEETAIEDIEAGIKIVEAVSDQLNLPVNFIVAPERLYNQVNSSYPLFALKAYIQYPWME